MVEQSAVNRWVVGSSPTSGASFTQFGLPALIEGGFETKLFNRAHSICGEDGFG